MVYYKIGDNMYKEYFSDDFNLKAIVNVMHKINLYWIDYYYNNKWIKSSYFNNLSINELSDIAEDYVLGLKS
jgi:hypothetical protein